ncbi:uncharacterized protein LOC113334529 [Papaver somniferum]|uniref:uncharacterized protein LOC113334529 n=1 Tax=Papaver somniferum TaxID=3469 RepID=UPI000E6F9BC5|nr:uncharacterized protein LOC113334529 [Papaver somniferum]
MKKFASLFQQHHLMDLPLIESHFTWNRNSSWSKLDRFLISSSWEENYLRIEQTTLPKPFSDHCPILLSTQSEGWGPTPCIFEKMWLQDPTIMELMLNWWHSFSFTGSPGFILEKKMQALKRKLCEWNREVFGKIDTLIQNNLIAGQLVESKLLLDPNNAQLATEKIETKYEFKRSTKMHNDFWKQRATINWVEEHENNTRFFHKYASSKQRAHDDANKLEIKFTEDEVKTALAELAQEKTPDPDGMPIFVISKSWDFMKHDILLVMEELYYNNSIDWRLRSTFLVLIPKMQDLEFMTDFRPISLMKNINKIISKVIARRLKRFFPQL